MVAGALPHGIVGLLRHGSGPRHTSRLDPGFSLHLAGYAAAVAQRHPWIDAYPRLDYQADFENTRRWRSLGLLLPDLEQAVARFSAAVCIA